MSQEIVERRAALDLVPAQFLPIGGRAGRESRKERLRKLWRSGELQRRAILGAPLLATLFAILAFGGVYGWAYGAAYLLVYLALGAWAVQLARGKAEFVPRAVYVPIVLFGVYAIAGYALGWTIVAGSTLTAIIHLAPAGAGFLLVTQLYRPGQDEAWLSPCLAIFTGILAFLAILQLFTASGAIYWHFRYTFASAAGPYVNRNHFAGCMEMLIPAASLEAFRHRHNRWPLVAAWATAPALGIAAVVLSASRGGAVALLAEGLGALAFLVLAWRRSSSHHRSSAMAAAAVVGLVGAMMIALVGTERLQARFAPPALLVDTISQHTRSELNQSSLAMWRAHPIAGWGLGTWEDVYPGFARFEDFRIYEFAHNDYLQLLAETGLIGMSLAGLFWLLWVRAVTRGLRGAGEVHPESHPEDSAFAVAACLACLGLLVHSWVDFNLHIPANLLLFFIMAGLGIA